MTLKENSAEKAYQAMLDAGLLKSKAELTNAELQNTIAGTVNSDLKAQEIMQSMGLSIALEGEETQTVKLTSEKLKAAVASGALTTAQAQEIAMATGVSVTLNTQTGSVMPRWIATLKASSLVIWDNVKATAAWLVTSPAGWLTLSVAAFSAFTIWSIKSTKTLKDLREEANETRQKADDLASEVESLNKELETTKNRLLELKKIGYKNLTIVEKDEYDKLVATNDELERKLRIKEALAQVASQEAGDAAKEALTKETEKSTTKKVNNLDARGEGNTFTTLVNPIDSLKEYIDLATQQQKQLSEAKQALLDFENTYAGTAAQMVQDKSWKKLSKNVTDTESIIKDTESTISEKFTAIETDAGGLVDAFNNVVPGCEDVYNEVNALTELLDNYFLLTGNVSKSIAQATEDASNSLSNSVAKTAEEIVSLKDGVDKAITSYLNLNAALASQETGKSAQLTDELSDYASCLEYVNGTMQISSEKARDLAKAKLNEKLATIEAQDAIEKAKYLENLRIVEEYTKLLGNNSSVLIDGVRITEDYIQSLKDSNQQIITNCDQYSLYASQIRQATGAYQEWLDSQNASESGDMFTDAGNAVKAIQEGLATGKINTIKYNAAVKFLVPDSIDPKNENEVKQYLKTLERYLADNGSGLNNFISDAINKGLIESTKDGMAQIVDGVTVQDFVDKLKITPEMARSIFGELEEYGWEFDWETESLSDLEDALFEAKQAVDALQEDVNTKKSLNIDSTEAQKALDDAKQTYQELVGKVTEQVDVQIDSEPFKEKLLEIQTLQEKINEASVHGGDFSGAKEKLDALKKELSELSGINTITIEAYVDDAQSKIDVLEEKLRHLPSASAAAADIEKEIRELKGNIEIVQTLKIEKDPSVDAAQKALDALDKTNIDDKPFTVIANTDEAMRKLEAVKNLLNEIRDTPVKPLLTSSLPVAEGTGKSGVGHANGSPGTDKTERALVGELGREILVDPKTGKWRTIGDNGAEFINVPKGSIIFNHRQTENLLDRGFVNGRGSAYASGNAFAGEGIIPGGGKEVLQVHGDDTIAENAKKLAKAAKSSKEITKEVNKQKKEYDWIKTALEYIARERQKIADIIEDENVSYKTQLSLLQELLDSDEQAIETNKSALDNYKNQWKTITDEILKSFGEAEGYDLISKIMYGNTSLDEWKDSFEFDSKDKSTAALMELLDKAIQIYASLIEQEDSYNDALAQRTEDQRKQFEIRIAIIESYLNEVNAAMNEAEAALKIKETTGHMITEADYEEMIRLANEQIDLYYDKLDTLEEKLEQLEDEGGEGSAEWNNIQSQISSCNDSINQCKQNQAEWNEEILNLPIRRIERYLEILKTVKQDLQNKLDEQESLGVDATKEQLQSMIDIETEQIKKLQDEHSELIKKLSNYEYGSDKFNETKQSIQDVEDEVSQLIQSQNKYNQQILQIPINQIDKLSNKLSDIKSSLDEITEGYDSAISAVTNAVDKQVKSIDDLKDATTKTYAEKIDPLQEKLDLINKTNEAIKIQNGLEQAQYASQRARNQKNIQAVQNGKLVYINDKDAERNANKSLQDAEMEKKKYEIQTQIETLEEERDKILEDYDTQIEKLNEIKDKWAEIADNIKNAQNNAVANDIFGKGWEDKVTSGNDSDIYEMMKKNYENVESQKQMYEKQIEANEKISVLMQQYIEAYQQGTLTFDQVLSKFDELVNVAKDGFSAEENLKALLSLMGSGDVNSAINDVQNQIHNSYDDFKNYLNAVNANEQTIAGYTQTWEEIKNAVVEQLELLKKQAEEEAKRVAEAKKTSKKKGSGSHSSSKGPDWNTPDGEATGPAKEIEERERAKNSHKDGLESSPIGRSVTANTEIVKAIGLQKLNPEEIASILHVGEVVVNPEQMNQMVENIRGLVPVSTMYRNPSSNLSTSSRNTKVEVNLGGVTLPGVTKGEEFVEAIKMNFASAMNQHFSKVFK